MPGLVEQYALVQTDQRPPSTDASIPVEATRCAVWPWEEKLGARPIGQWLYDEIVTLTRFA